MASIITTEVFNLSYFYSIEVSIKNESIARSFSPHGYVQAISKAFEPIRTYNIPGRVVSRDKFYYLKDFYNSMNGTEMGFLIKDPIDNFATRSPKRLIDSFGKSLKVYTQGVVYRDDTYLRRNWLAKAYSVATVGGFDTFTRIIKYAYDVSFFNSNGQLSSGVGYVPDTGRVENSGGSVSAEFSFRVPVRFDGDLTYEVLRKDDDAYAQIGQLRLVEVKQPMVAAPWDS